MKRIMLPKSLIFLLLLLAMPISSVQAASDSWNFDKAHSSFRFNVRHIYSTVSGYFEDYDGTVKYDPANPTAAQFSFTIKVKSIQTGIGKRDTHLRSDDFFSAKKYPEIRFESKTITPAGGDLYNVAGTLTMKDVSKEIVLPMVFHGTKDNPLNQKQRVAGFDAQISIDRLEYNVGSGKFYQMGVVDKDVQINISLEMLQDK